MSTTMAPQAPAPAFGFAFPQSSSNDPYIVDTSNCNPTFDDFGFDFSAFTNFDLAPATIDDGGLGAFDADAFNQYMGDTSEPSLADSTSTPASTAIVSPKSSLSSFEAHSPFAPSSTSNSALGLSSLAPLPEPTRAQSTIDIEALSNHHLERFLHYKALADEAQRKAEANALAQAQAQAQAQQQSAGGFQALLAPFDLNVNTNMSIGPMAPSAPASHPAPVATKGIDGSMLLSYAAPPPAPLAPRQSASFSYDPVMAEASMAQAQADAHLQAHTAAAAQVQQQRMQTQYWVHSNSNNNHSHTHSARSSFDQASAPMSEPAWSRSSFASTHAGSYPSTPQYVAAPVMPLPAPVPGMQTAKADLPPMMAPIPPVSAPFATAPLPMPITNAGVPPSIPMTSFSASDQSSGSMDSVKKPILNPHGGGRGYIPGKTPDDPKKRHKCDICGRGFARAFNLKSHMATHDPERSKPHMCPHRSCKRGFSRLHDLERHRQGIHNDGPLVDAKVHGVTLSVARAQVRSQKSSSSTSTMASAGSANVGSLSATASVADTASASPEAVGMGSMPMPVPPQPNMTQLQLQQQSQF